MNRRVFGKAIASLAALAGVGRAEQQTIAVQLQAQDRGSELRLALLEKHFDRTLHGALEAFKWADQERDRYAIVGREFHLVSSDHPEFMRVGANS